MLKYKSIVSLALFEILNEHLEKKMEKEEINSKRKRIFLLHPLDRFDKAELKNPFSRSRLRSDKKSKIIFLHGAH